jgi:hypothetical protein
MTSPHEEIKKKVKEKYMNMVRKTTLRIKN